MAGISGEYIYDKDGTIIGATGAKKAALNNLKKDPDFYKKMGAKGGRNGTTGGFAANPELARILGSKGGKISRRGKKK